MGGYANPRLRHTFADDVHLAETVKRRGWRKSIYGDVVGRPLYGLAGGLAALGFGLLPPLTLLRALVRRDLSQAALATITLIAQAGTRRPFDRDAGMSWGWTISTPLGWSAMGLLLFDATRQVVLGVGADWKGRDAPGRE